MKTVSGEYSIIEPGYDKIDMYKHVEHAARICYKTEGAITDDSYKHIINDVLKRNGHYSPFGHGGVYLCMHKDDYFSLLDKLHKIDLAPGLDAFQHFANPLWTRIIQHDDYWYISTSYRAIYEADIEDIMEKYWCKPTPYHVLMRSVVFTGDRGIMDDLMRHFAAICCESTRYCDYTSEKKGGEITICERADWDTLSPEIQEEYINAYKDAEKHYFKLRELGLQPQFAKRVLPFAIKCTVMFTAFGDQWQHIFDMRTSHAHPDLIALMKPLAKDFYNKGFIAKQYD